MENERDQIKGAIDFAGGIELPEVPGVRSRASVERSITHLTNTKGEIISVAISREIDSYEAVEKQSRLMAEASTIIESRRSSASVIRSSLNNKP